MCIFGQAPLQCLLSLQGWVGKNCEVQHLPSKLSSTARPSPAPRCSVFGEDALVNVSVEKLPDGRLGGYLRIRWAGSKEKTGGEGQIAPHLHGYAGWVAVPA